MKRPYRFRSAAIVAILTTAFLATGRAYADETTDLPQVDSDITLTTESEAVSVDLSVSGVAKNSDDTIRPADTATPSYNNVLAHVEGTFFEPDKDSILKQLNAIRKEAVDLGYATHYVPLKWSSELEKTTMTRAVEADLTLDHTRLTDQSWHANIPNSLKPASENLYWNGYISKDTFDASIKGWYAEKVDYELERSGKTPLGETGHYKSIINPTYTHTAVSAFHVKNQTQTGQYPFNWATTAQVLATIGGQKDDPILGNYQFNKQTLTVDPKHITSATVTDKLDLKTQESKPLTLAATIKITDKSFQSSTETPVTVAYSHNWRSSNTAVASVDSNGVVTGRGAGTATISLSLNGKTYSTQVTVTGTGKEINSAPSSPSQPTTGFDIFGLFGGSTISNPSPQPVAPKPVTPPVVTPSVPSRPTVTPPAPSQPATGFDIFDLFGGSTISNPSPQPVAPKPVTPPVVTPSVPSRPTVTPPAPSQPATGFDIFGLFGGLTTSQPTPSPTSSNPAVPKGFSRGIDISEHQGSINWSLLKDHIDYVIIRAGFGTVRPDLRFHEYVRGAEANGIPYGFYWYSYSLNPEVAKEEAKFFLNTIKPYQPKLPIFIDMEDADHWKANQGAHHPANTWAGREAIIHTHAKAYQDAGYKAGVYASRSWFDQMSPALNAYEKWVAHWGVGTELYKNTSYGMHQHTSSGRLPGISTNVDMNIAFKNYLLA